MSSTMGALECVPAQAMRVHDERWSPSNPNSYSTGLGLEAAPSSPSRDTVSPSTEAERDVFMIVYDKTIALLTSVRSLIEKIAKHDRDLARQFRRAAS